MKTQAGSTHVQTGSLRSTCVSENTTDSLPRTKPNLSAQLGEDHTTGKIMILLLNAAVMPSEGVYTLKKISQAEFRTCLREASATGDFKSYIGYPETARIIEEITGVPVKVNREQADLLPGDAMLIVKLRQRVSEPASKAALAPSSDDFEFYQCQWHTLDT